MYITEKFKNLFLKKRLWCSLSPTFQPDRASMYSATCTDIPHQEKFSEHDANCPVSLPLYLLCFLPRKPFLPIGLLESTCSMSPLLAFPIPTWFPQNKHTVLQIPVFTSSTKLHCMFSKEMSVSTALSQSPAQSWGRSRLINAHMRYGWLWDETCG